MGRSDGPEIVARAAELEVARRLLRRALEGPAAILVIGGEAGIGKSELVEAVASDAHGLGFRLAIGACLRMDAGATPYAPIVGALRQLVRSEDPGVLASTLGGGRREVARLLPEVARLATPAARSTTPGGSTIGGAPPSGAAIPTIEVPDPLARLRLFEAVGTWLDNLTASAPLLLTVEDLQWADPASLDLLRSLARLLASRALITVTLRTDEPAPPPVQATIAELVRDGAVRMELTALDRSGLARLASRALETVPDALDPDAIDRLHEMSGGNPFLALELIEAGLLQGTDSPYAGVPPSLRDILDARLVVLDERVQEVLRAAALESGPVDDEVLAAVLDRPIAAIGDAIREARDAGVLAPGPGAPRFRHALQRDILVERLGPGERRMLHGRFADALAAGDGDGAGDPVRLTAIAIHRDGAGDDARSLEAHLRALEAADRAFAFEAAARHARRAAELTRRATRGPDGGGEAVRLLERASFDTFLAGDPAGSATAARDALALLAEDDERAVVLHDRLRWALWEAGDRDGARRELELALRSLGEHPADQAAANLRARLTAQQAAMRMDDADPGSALALANEAIEAARDLDAPDIEAIALGVRGHALAIHGQVDEGLASLRAAVAIADRIGNLQGRLVGEAELAALLARCGRAREALAETDAALAVAESSGLGRSLGAQLAAEAARSCFAIGAWDEADRRIADGLARRPSAVPEAQLRAVALRLAAARGRMADAAALDLRLRALEPALAHPEDRASLDIARAELALAAGRPIDVRAVVDRQLATAADAGPGAGAEPGPSLAWLAALVVRAEADLELDARARSDEPGAREAWARRQVVTRIVERQAAAGMAAWGPRAEALLAQLQAEGTRLDAASGSRVEAWRRAATAWLAIDRPYVAAYARFREAEARLAMGDPRAAIAEPLQDAAGVLRSLGARPLLAQVERLARLARIDLERVGRSAADGTTAGASAPDPLATLDLTPREREVLRLVAAGWSNARIAETLGISVKTASVHVSNILAKLGVENRVAAAALAHRLGVVAVQADVDDVTGA